MFKNVCFLERKKHSHYSSSKYVFILLHLFVFFVLYEEKLARLFLYNLKHRPNDLTYIETTQYLFRWEVRLPNKRPSDLEVQHQRLCICDLTGIAIEMIFDHKCELKYSFWICRWSNTNTNTNVQICIHFRCTICCWSQFVQFTRWKQEKYLKTSTRPNL